VLAITGTNGKTTVTAMTGALCRAAGLDACVAGNIAPPVLDALMQREDSGAPPDVWVLELSSFQLETTYSLNATAGVVLNLSQDHCDRYHGMEDYAAAKARVFRGTGIQIVNRDDPLSRSMATPGRRAFTFGLGEPELKGDWGIAERAGRAWLAENGDRVMPVDELQIAGLQNAANALAALALCRAIDLPYAPLVEGLRAFRGLPHRVEHVAEIDGVVFFDDSKGTNVGATVAALAGIGRPTVLIAGGDGKGQDFTPLKPAVAAHARAVVLLGRDGPAIGRALAGSGVPVLAATTLPDAVNLAFGVAQQGDAVLLSPACASFDMFRNYEHRAQVFVAAVRALEAVR
jgi:UDP-N-acetylmuramoylalanine--D-glutamate ligase